MRDIDFPPVKTLTLRTRISVMVVVPSLSKRDECEEEAVLAVVTCLKTRLTDDVSK